MVTKMPANSAATSAMAWKVNRFAWRMEAGVTARQVSAAATRATSRTGVGRAATLATTTSRSAMLRLPLTCRGRTSVRSRMTSTGDSRACSRRSQK